MVKTRTKAELKRSHDAMAAFLVELCRYSDERQMCGEERGAKTKHHYERARRLIRSAGLKYELKYEPKP